VHLSQAWKEGRALPSRDEWEGIWARGRWGQRKAVSKQFVYHTGRGLDWPKRWRLRSYHREP
jgi:hypothetical protein